MTRGRGGAAVLALAGALAAAAGCEHLGNPPSPNGHTPVTRWSNGILLVLSSAQSARAGDANRLLAQYRAHQRQLSYQDSTVATDGVLTIVTISLQVLDRRAILSPHLPLQTTFVFHGGTTTSRTWLARGNRTDFHAAFALPEPPLRAATALAP